MQIFLTVLMIVLNIFSVYLGVMALCCLVAILTCHETKNVDYMQ